MKAVISSTYDNLYYFFLPITVYCWNKIGIDVICFMPGKPSRYNYNKYLEWAERSMLIHNTILKQGLRCEFKYFISDDDKQATYAQCSRLYAAAIYELDENEILITGDVDMAVFKVPPHKDCFTIWGSDLVPQGQYPICYATASVKEWRNAFELNGITYQQALDRLLENDNCQDFRACRWSVDQEQLYLKLTGINTVEIPRSNGQNQFAQNRVDRDDSFWRDRLNLSIIDAHLWRNGYEEQNHKNIIELLTTMYPNDSFEWLETYRNEYLKLL